MDTIKKIMDTIYASNEALIVIYVTGAILLLIFIALLIVSLRKPKISKKENKKVKTVEDESKENAVQTTVSELAEENKTDSVIETNNNTSDIKEEISNIPDVNIKIEKDENPVSKALNNIENQNNEEKKEEIKIVEENKLSSEIPNVDEFVNDVVKKTYEKNEQFSSVYNTSSVKLDKVLDKLNVDENVKESIIQKEETNLNTETKKEDITTNNINSLDLLKQQLEEKNKTVDVREEVANKQDDLKEKLANLKKEEPKAQEALNPEDLLKKLNAMKEQ